MKIMKISGQNYYISSNISLLQYILVPIPFHISPQKTQELKSIEKLLKYKLHKISKQSPTEI